MVSDKIKVVHLTRWPIETINKMTAPDVLERVNNVVVNPEAPISEIKETIKDAEILFGDWTRSIKITKEILQAAKKCKLFHQPTVGYETIDIQAARECGIDVSNGAGMNSIAVAEHAIMMMLILIKKAIWMHEETSKGNWMYREAAGKGWITELSSKTIGIIGFGNSGKELAKRLRVFTPNVLYTKRSRLSEPEEEEYGVSYRSMENLLRESDVVSLHVPLTEETRGLINADSIGLMKDNAVLLNLARAEVMDVIEVKAALESGKLGGVGVDVFNPEPISPDYPLIGVRNVVLSPHLAGSTAETVRRSLGIATTNFRRFFDGKKPINLLN
jgi:glyoxylate reductase